MSAISLDIETGALPRGWGPFAATSQRFLAELIARLDDGGFHDPRWVRELLIAADILYIDAVRSPATRTPPWRIAGAAIERSHKPAMRNLLLGVFSHIAYDLVVTLVPRLTPGDAHQRADFLRINDIIAGAIDGVQAEIRAGTGEWVTWADVGFSRVDELATWTMFKYTRARAFADAGRLASGELTVDDVARRAVRLIRLLTIIPL